MFEELFQYIESHSGTRLTADDRRVIETKFHHRRLLRRQFFLQEGEVCKKMAFIVKGAARMYSIDDKGHEHIVRFGLESWWLEDQESYTLMIPSRYHIEMLEDCDLLVIGTDHVHELRDMVRGFDLTVKAVDRQSLIASQKRIHAAISMTAEERYDDLLKSYPEFVKRFPRNMIASYLGISAETLSRMCKNMAGR